MLAVERVASSNRLISAPPSKERSRLLASSEEVELTFAEVLVEPGCRVRYIYFPIDSFISLVGPVNGAASLEVGLVGNEGVNGISLALEIDVFPLRGLVRGSGPALRMSAAVFKREYRGSSAFKRQPSIGLLIRRSLNPCSRCIEAIAVIPAMWIAEERGCRDCFSSS